MQIEKFQHIDAPCAWLGADKQNTTDWLRPFSAVELAEVDAALQSVKQRGLDLFDIGKEDFPLPLRPLTTSASPPASEKPSPEKSSRLPRRQVRSATESRIIRPCFQRNRGPRAGAQGVRKRAKGAAFW